MSTLKVNTIQNTSGVEVYTAKAWVNFNGTFGTSPFTIANGGIRAAGNVSSVTDNGVGNYTINFTNNMPTTNYATTVTAGTGVGSGSYLVCTLLFAPAAESIKIRIVNPYTNGQEDAGLICVAIFS